MEVWRCPGSIPLAHGLKTWCDMERQIKNLAILPVDKWVMGACGKLRVGNSTVCGKPNNWITSRILAVVISAG